MIDWPILGKAILKVVGVILIAVGVSALVAMLSVYASPGVLFTIGVLGIVGLIVWIEYRVMVSQKKWKQR